MTLGTYWASDTQVNASYTVDAQAPVGQHTVTLRTAAGQALGAISIGVLTVTQSPQKLDLSTGDTNKYITTSVSPGSYSFTPTFAFALAGNYKSTCNANLGFSNNSGTGTVNTTVTAGPAGCSGVFNAFAVVGQKSSSSSTQVIVPPQISVQMLYGEAHGQVSIGDNVSQLAIGVATRNRFSQPGFSGVTTYQAAITPTQFIGLSNITNGPIPDVDNAAAVFTSTDGTSVLNAACFFSPTNAGWIAIQSALQSGTTTLPAVSPDPGCYQANRQFVVKRSVGNNADGRGAPAFIFEQQRNPASDPAVIQIP